MSELTRLEQDLVQELANLSGNLAELQAGLREGELRSLVASKLATDVPKLVQQVQDLQILISQLRLRSRQLEAGPLATWSTPRLTGSPN
mgnify:CR=1 FL=1